MSTTRTCTHQPSSAPRRPGPVAERTRRSSCSGPCSRSRRSPSASTSSSGCWSTGTSTSHPGSTTSCRALLTRRCCSSVSWRSPPACWWRVAPRLGGYVVALWLAGIIVNLLTLGDYYDIALRDFGLLVGALALARLATPDAASEPRGELRHRLRPGLGPDRAGRTDRHRGRRPRRGRRRGGAARGGVRRRDRAVRRGARGSLRAPAAVQGLPPGREGARVDVRPAAGVVRPSTASTCGWANRSRSIDLDELTVRSDAASPPSAGCCSPPAPGRDGSSSRRPRRSRCATCGRSRTPLPCGNGSARSITC